MADMDNDFQGLEETSPVVRYSAKELFAQINRKLDVVLELAQSKASQADYEVLVAKVDGHDSRIQTLEDRGTNRLEAVKAFAWIVGTGIAALTMLTGLGVLIYYVMGANA